GGLQLRRAAARRRGPRLPQVFLAHRQPSAVEPGRNLRLGRSPALSPGQPRLPFLPTSQRVWRLPGGVARGRPARLAGARSPLLHARTQAAAGWVLTLAAAAAATATARRTAATTGRAAAAGRGAAG